MNCYFLPCRNGGVDPDSHIYEYLPSAYAIMMILLNPDIDSTRICKKVPTSVTTDATYIIDVTSLAHLDDVKKDNFSRWNYKGSHSIPIYVRIKSNGQFNVKRCQERRGK